MTDVRGAIAALRSLLQRHSHTGADGSLQIGTAAIADGSLLLTDFASGVAATNAWSPALSGSGTPGTFTYALQSGRYARIGPLVFFSFVINISFITVAPTLNLSVNLPVAVLNDTAAFIACALEFSTVNLSAGYTTLLGRAVPNTSQLRLFEAGDNVGAQQLQGSTVAVNFQLIGGGSYFAA